MHCPSSANQDPNYVNIGNTALIDKPRRRHVPIPPGVTLSDYVPFYFTPFSIMMYNIKTGYGGITRRDDKDIVMFVSSVHRLEQLAVPFVFTNQPAYAVELSFTMTFNIWTRLIGRSYNVGILRPTIMILESNFRIRQKH